MNKFWQNFRHDMTRRRSGLEINVRCTVAQQMTTLRNSFIFNKKMLHIMILLLGTFFFLKRQQFVAAALVEVRYLRCKKQ